MDMLKAELYFDGSSFARGRRGGPGKSAAAAVLILDRGSRSIHSRFLPSTDSDHAEYQGLILGLEAARAEGVSSLEIFGDSRNVIDAVLGKKKLKKLSLLELLDEVKLLLEGFNVWTLRWIPREKNLQADAAARDCILSTTRTALPHG